MSKIAQYLQEHLLGEVSSSADVRRHLAHDGSVLRIIPLAAVYPRDESDIRKTARFCWQLAERGRPLAMTVRGSGSSTSGAAIGGGLIVSTSAHMNRVLELDPKKKQVVVEPGISYDKLQQTLFTHGLSLGCAPESAGLQTVGGSLGANEVGERSLYYGDLLKHTESLRVVLANGEVIETGPLSKRELNRKMGLSSFEGQVYRALDKLLEENEDTVTKLKTTLGRIDNGIGYRLDVVKQKDGFDLTPLFIGAQGSLGIISEVRLKLDIHNPTTTLALVSLNSLDDMALVLPQILKLKPSLLDFITKDTLSMVSRLNPTQLANALGVHNAAAHLFIEFNEAKHSTRAKCLKSLTRIAESVDGYVTSSQNQDDQQRIWKLRQISSTVVLQPDGAKRAVPLADNIVVPPTKLAGFLKDAKSIFTASSCTGSMWGQAGRGIVHCYVHLDLAQVGDRQRFFKLSENLFRAATAAGGSISASGEGRVAAPYVSQLYGRELEALTRKVKNIFDPHNILNPGVKNLNMDELIGLIRTDYNVAHRHDHLSGL